MYWKPMIRTILRVALPAALLVGLPVSPVWSQPVQRQASPALGQNFDAEAPRDSALRMLDQTERFIRDFSPQNFALLEQLKQARTKIHAAGDSDLQALAQLAPQLDRMMQVMRQVRRIVDSPPSESLVPASAPFPDAAYPSVSWAFNLDSANSGDNDPDDLPGGTGGATSGALCNSTRKADSELFLLLTDTLLAEALQMVASRACDQVVVVIGGGNGSLVCIITDLIYLAVRGANDFINYCEDQNDGAELHASYLRLGHLHTDLGNTETSINNNVDAAETNLTTTVNNATTSINNNVDAAETNILNVVQAGQDFTLRLEIEKALRFDTRLASIYLPEARGGKLSLVRQIVLDSIANVAASGQSVSTASRTVGSGDAAAASCTRKPSTIIHRLTSSPCGCPQSRLSNEARRVTRDRCCPFLSRECPPTTHSWRRST